MKSIIKTMLLSLLIITSIYQIGKLWFDDISNDNFFHEFIDGSTDTIISPEAKQKHIITPNILGVYLGMPDIEFTIVKKTSKRYEDMYDQSIRILSEVFKSGKLEGKTRDSEIIWRNKGVLFSLSFTLPKDLFAQDLGIGESLLDGINSIKSIGIIPATTEHNNIVVYLVEDTNEIYMYSLDKNEIEDANDKLNRDMEQIMESEGPQYISSLKNDITLFNKDILLPIANEKYNAELLFTTPYVAENAFLDDSLESYINNYFANPGAKWEILKGNEIRYGDDKILIKYNLNGIFEYINLEEGNNGGADIISSYNSAVKFLEKDVKLIQQEYFLTNYKVKDNSITFYYSYSSNDFPIVIDSQLKQQYELIEPMEITVTNGKVSSYKRILLEQEDFMQEREIFSASYEDAIAKFMQEYDIRKNSITDMYLGYFYENSGYATMQWIIEYNDTYFIRSLN